MKVVLFVLYLLAPLVPMTTAQEDVTITFNSTDLPGTSIILPQRDGSTTRAIAVETPDIRLRSTTGAVMVRSTQKTKDSDKLTEASLEGRGNFTVKIPDEYISLYEDQVDVITISFPSLNEKVKIHLRSNDEDVFLVLNDTSHFDPKDIEVHNGSLTIHMHGKRLGISHVYLTIYDTEGEVVIQSDVKFVVKTKRVPRTVDAIFDMLLLPLLVITCTGMGCKMEFDIIKEKLKKPLIILVGPICQFIFQPLYAFCLSKALKLTGMTAVGLVTVASCPGGGMSNMITLLIGADLIQSVTMTFTSTCLAVGVLPLNMFIYANHFVKESESTFQIPFGSIITQIGLLAGPILIGMFFRYKFPKLAYYIAKPLSVVSLVMVLLTLVVGVVSNWYCFAESKWNTMLGAFLLPCCGFITGFLVSRFIARFEMESAMTVSVETGVQNNLIAISMIKLSYPQPEADIMARMPVIVATTSLTVGLGMIAASFPIHRRRREKKQRKGKDRNVSDQYDRITYKSVPSDGKHVTASMPRNGDAGYEPMDMPPDYKDASGNGQTTV